MTLPTREEFQLRHMIPVTCNTAPVAEADLICPICLSKCDIEERKGIQPPNELAVRLDCGHIVGEVCMRQWIGTRSPSGMFPNTCVKCRAKLYDNGGRDAREERLYVQQLSEQYGGGFDIDGLIGMARRRAGYLNRRGRNRQDGHQEPNDRFRR